MPRAAVASECTAMSYFHPMSRARDWKPRASAMPAPIPEEPPVTSASGRLVATAMAIAKVAAAAQRCPPALPLRLHQPDLGHDPAVDRRLPRAAGALPRAYCVDMSDRERQLRSLLGRRAEGRVAGRDLPARRHPSNPTRHDSLRGLHDRVRRPVGIPAATEHRHRVSQWARSGSQRWCRRRRA